MSSANERQTNKLNSDAKTEMKAYVAGELVKKENGRPDRAGCRTKARRQCARAQVRTRPHRSAKAKPCRPGGASPRDRALSQTTVWLNARITFGVCLAMS